MRTLISNKYCQLLLVFISCLFMGTNVQAQDRWVEYLSISPSTSNDTLLIQDDRFGNTSKWNEIESILSVQNMILLEVNEDTSLISPDPVSYEVKLEVEFWMANDDPTVRPAPHSIMDSLIIHYDPDASQAASHRALRFYEGAHQMRIKVLSVLPINGSNPVTPPVMRIAGQIKVDRTYAFDCQDKSTFISVPLFSSRLLDEYQIEWNSIDGAEEYDLEWTFYDTASVIGRQLLNGGGSSYEDFDFLFKNNATRVTVAGLSHKVQLLYPEGFLFFRVRAARMRPEGWREFGLWSSLLDNFVNLQAFPDKIRVGWHEDNQLNWQANTVFAEEGKNIPSVSYYDGTLRGRQQVTLSNSINKTIVGQTIYDYHGRPAVNIIPSPSDTNRIGFNPLFAATAPGQAFGKDDFDLNQCDTMSLQPLSEDYGVAKYYSRNNLDAGHDFHRYIPDAEGFPYSITEYTPDLSGRIRRQGGVGPDYQLGSGRETRYFYGKPLQVELDRLFGEDVGHFSHFLKNGVIDANGQASISYVDAHGRTIATALAGTPPDSVEQIDTGFENVSIVSANLLDNQAPKDFALISTHKYINVSPGDQSFTYSIGPDQFRKDCLPAVICYDCLYDLQIVISGNDCNAFNGGQPFDTLLSNYSFGMLDTLCSETNSGGAINVAFTKNLPIGEYTITKTLTVSEESLDYYTEHYLSQSACVPMIQDLVNNFVSQIDTSGCDLSCEDCLASLGPETTYINELMQLRSEAGTPITEAEAREAYERRVESCELMCLNPTDCQITWLSMLADMSPGGQYALFDTAVIDTVLSNDPTSIFYNNAFQVLSNNIVYLDANGDPDSVFNASGQLVPPTALTSIEFYSSWQTSWAETLVKEYHPEYCLYQQWCENNGLDTFDYCVILSEMTWQMAVDSNLADSSGIIYDPAFEPGGVGYDCLQQRDSLLGNVAAGVSLVEFVSRQIYGDNNCNGGLGSGTDNQNKLAWELYRSLYCSVVRQLFSEKKEALNCLLQDCIGNQMTASCDGLPINYYAFKEKRFTSFMAAGTYTLEEAQMLSDLAQQGIKDFCESACEENVDIWLMQLQDCNLSALSSSSLNELKARLKEVCETGCDREHPFGASTTPDGVLSFLGDSSFKDIISHFIPEADLCSLDCSPQSITSMRPFNQALYRGAEARLSLSNTCVCENLTELQTCYNNLPAGSYASFSQYLSQFSYTRLSTDQIDTLLHYCSTAPFDLLPQPIPIPAYLECNTCKDCQEMTGLKDAFDATICTPSSPDYDELLARHLNIELGFSLGWDEYKDFFDSCTMSTACPASLILCPIAGELANSTEVDECYRSRIMQAEFNAALALQDIMDSLRQDFRNAYKDSCLANATEMFRGQFRNQEYHYTLYYYDQAGNLVQTVPPNGVQVIVDTNTLNLLESNREGGTTAGIYPSHSFLTKYRYNTLGQVVEQISPDTDKSQFWYDAIGRVILSQDGRQRPHHLYSYTRYDNLGRIVEVGEKEEPNFATIDFETFARNTSLFSNWLTNGPPDSRTQITRTYYDKAPFVISAFDDSLQLNLRTRVASVSFEAVNDDQLTTYDYATHYSYDISGNVNVLVQEVQDLHPFNQGYKRIDYDYDYVSGNVNTVYYQHGQADQFTHRYEYDANNRLTDVYSSLIETDGEGLLWDRDATYIYYDHGPLARSIIGHQQVQGMDYAYTLQGWIKGVNSSGLLPQRDMGKDGLTSGPHTAVARDALGYTLGYYQGEYQPIGGTSFEMALSSTSSLNTSANNLFNGNIRYMSIHNRGLDGPMAYSYRYDQLHRIKNMQSHDNADLSNFSWGNTGTNLYGMTASYDGNGNIQTLTRDGLLPGTNLSAEVNVLDYNYQSGTNRLQSTIESADQCQLNITIIDPISENTQLFAEQHITASSEIDGSQKIQFQADNCVELLPGFEVTASGGGDFVAMNGPCPPSSPVTSNYVYDGTGNLVKSEDADTLIWSPYGKVLEVHQSNNNRKTLFGYDAAQNRAMKAQVNSAAGDTTYTYYYRDASNNVLAIYRRQADTIQWLEQNLYGSSRLGHLRPDIRWTAVDTFQKIPYFVETAALKVGWKGYELSNHLGNVLATVSDRKVKVDSSGNGQADWYEAKLISASDYYPFGLEMRGRTMSAESYRYGFNGKERDRDGEWGKSTHYDYGFRIYNPTIAKFLSVDPLTKDYPKLTPYQFASNRPIDGIDLDGAEYKAVGGWYDQNVGSKLEIKKWDHESNDSWLESGLKFAGNALVEISNGVTSYPTFALSNLTRFDRLQSGAEIETAASDYLANNTTEEILQDLGDLARDPGTYESVAAIVLTRKAGKIIARGNPTNNTIDGVLSKNPTLQTADELQLKGAGLFDKKKKTFQTYTAELKDGTIYSGRTSGVGKPKDNVSKRAAGHHMKSQFKTQPELDKSSTNKAAIRGREQILIEKNGGAQSKGGSSGNSINGVGPKNKNKNKYLQAARRLFGKSGDD